MLVLAAKNPREGYAVSFVFCWRVLGNPHCTGEALAECVEEREDVRADTPGLFSQIAPSITLGQ